jgi:hypothetical protein
MAMNKREAMAKKETITPAPKLDHLNKMSQKDSDELKPEELEGVSGGVYIIYNHTP